MLLLSLLPEDIVCRVVHFVFATGPPLLGVQRAFGVVGTRIVIRDEKVYRRGNTPPTPVVKRALMAVWRSGMATGGRVELRVVALGTRDAVRYSCDLRGFAEGDVPTELSHLRIGPVSS